MGLSDWNISGDGGQSIVNVDDSMRCILTYKKLMLYNGRSDLNDSEVTFSIKGYTIHPGFYRAIGGSVLRMDSDGLNGYKIVVGIRFSSPNRMYSVYRVVNGVATLLNQIPSLSAYNEYIKTRIRIDGWKISIHEWDTVTSLWKLIALEEDDLHSFSSGYAGIIGDSLATYSVSFNNIEIKEKT